MASKVRIGFVGVGSMGQCAHLKNYACLVNECEVVALAEIRPRLAHAVAQKYNVPRIYITGEEMIAQEHLDGIVAAQPFDRHGQIISPLYKAGVPVLTEKPLAASPQVGEQMLAALSAGGSWHMVGYHKRSDPATMYARAEIDRLKQTGELGRLRYVRITMPPGDWIAGGFNDLIQTDEPYPQLAPDPPADDMDAETYEQYVRFVNYYIHQVNLLRYLLGEPYRVTFADRAGMVMGSESVSGVTGVLEMSPYQTSVDWHESALVCFEYGYIKLDLPAPLAMNRPGQVQIFRDPGKGSVPQTVAPTLPWVHAMRQQAVNFIRAIRGEISPPCDAQEAMEDLRIAREYFKLWKGV
ncbi:MAG: Gfo/Idh/MocA family oxidoreductase [Anaerolineae bacterium]|nr:Gfo/Idh/MocA family oxidoreductase [Thermoflexales bacterium]MDW8409002.1 Gfo/Idh/MocA family oxidoreductase [Anaerolineae bacterium]